MSKNKQGEKQQSKLQVFFMVVFIPAVFAVILAVVLLYYLGFNVGAYMQDAASFLPFTESEETEDEGDREDLPDEEYIAQLEHENDALHNEVAGLEAQTEELEDEIENLEDELLLFDTGGEESGDGNNGETVTVDLDDVVRTLQEMTPSRAADIVEEMPEAEAVTYFREMSPRDRSDILSRIEPELAASILDQLSE